MPVPPLASDIEPVSADVGKPVQFVNVPLAGVPNAGVTKVGEVIVGDVPNTLAPVPVIVVVEM